LRKLEERKGVRNYVEHENRLEQGAVAKPTICLRGVHDLALNVLLRRESSNN